MPTHKEAIQMVLDALTNEKTGAIKSLKEVDAIGHRVVHGGEKFASSAVITDEMIKAVEECNDLAPLHNPANLIGIRVCSELMPGVPQVGVFDTAFHQTMPPKAYLYGLPLDYYKTIRSEDMVSMEPPTALFPNVLLNSWAWTKKTQKLLYATWVTDHLSVQL